MWPARQILKVTIMCKERADWRCSHSLPGNIPLCTITPTYKWQTTSSSKSLRSAYGCCWKHCQPCRTKLESNKGDHVLDRGLLTCGWHNGKSVAAVAELLSSICLSMLFQARSWLLLEPAGDMLELSQCLWNIPCIECRWFVFFAIIPLAHWHGMLSMIGPLHTIEQQHHCCPIWFKGPMFLAPGKLQPTECWAELCLKKIAWRRLFLQCVCAHEITNESTGGVGVLLP